MVYCGKASQGCQSCRTRRIKVGLFILSHVARRQGSGRGVQYEEAWSPAQPSSLRLHIKLMAVPPCQRHPGLTRASATKFNHSAHNAYESASSARDTATSCR